MVDPVLTTAVSNATPQTRLPAVKCSASSRISVHSGAKMLPSLLAWWVIGTVT